MEQRFYIVGSTQTKNHPNRRKRPPSYIKISHRITLTHPTQRMVKYS